MERTTPVREGITEKQALMIGFCVIAALVVLGVAIGYALGHQYGEKSCEVALGVAKPVFNISFS